MKTSTQILIGISLAIILFIVQGMLLAQTNPESVPPSISISGGGFADWLVIRRANLKAWDSKAFDPVYTSAVCQFKPLVIKQADGTFLIEFQTDL